MKRIKQNNVQCTPQVQDEKTSLVDGAGNTPDSTPL